MITLCKCGAMTTPGEKYCKSCYIDTLPDDVSKNIFTGGRFYGKERRNMREKIAEIIQGGAGDISFGYGEYAALLYHKQIISPIADKILNLISEEMEKVENPYETEGRHWQLQIKAFEDCRNKILNLLRPKEKEVNNE